MVEPREEGGANGKGGDYDIRVRHESGGVKDRGPATRGHPRMECVGVWAICVARVLQ